MALRKRRTVKNKRAQTRVRGKGRPLDERLREAKRRLEKATLMEEIASINKETEVILKAIRNPKPPTNKQEES